jgi:hypothetical protein
MCTCMSFNPDLSTVPTKSHPRLQNNLGPCQLYIPLENRSNLPRAALRFPMQTLCSSSVPLMNRPTPLIRPFSLLPHPNRLRASNRTASRPLGEIEISLSFFPFHLKYTQQRYNVSLMLRMCRTYTITSTAVCIRAHDQTLAFIPSPFPPDQISEVLSAFSTSQCNRATCFSLKMTSLCRRISQSFRLAFAVRLINIVYSLMRIDLPVVLHFPVSFFPP